MNKTSERYSTKVEIPISVILETIFSDDNKDVETLCRWAKKYGFVDLEDNHYKLQPDYTKQSFYILLDKEERKQYDYEDYLIDENEKLKEKVNKAIEYIEKNISFCENDSQGAYDVCRIRIASDKKLLEILKGGD